MKKCLYNVLVVVVYKYLTPKCINTLKGYTRRSLKTFISKRITASGGRSIVTIEANITFYTLTFIS